jgi:plastocyanin
MMHAGWSWQKGALALPVLLSIAAQAQDAYTVRIENYRFTPPEVSIRVGDTVRWNNHEKRTSHSVILPIAGVPESERMFPDDSWSYRFDQAGRYEYHCGPHPEMTGVIRVGD